MLDNMYNIYNMYLNTKYSFLVTLIISIVVQIISGIIDVFSLLILSFWSFRWSIIEIAVLILDIS